MHDASFLPCFIINSLKVPGISDEILDVTLFCKHLNLFVQNFNFVFPLLVPLGVARDYLFVFFLLVSDAVSNLKVPQDRTIQEARRLDHQAWSWENWEAGTHGGHRRCIA